MLVVIAGQIVVLKLVANFAFGGFDWLLAVALALGPVPALLALGMWLDRFEPEPVWLLARTFLWGAAVAILTAGIVNNFVALALRRVRRDGRQRPSRRRGDEGPGRAVRVPAAA